TAMKWRVSRKKGQEASDPVRLFFLYGHPDTEQEISAIFEHQESATTRVSFFVSFPRVGSKPSPSLSRSSRTRCNSGSPSLFRSREQLPWVRAPWSLVGRNKPAAGRPFQLSCSPSLSSQARAIC